ncbi:BREX-1 system phosphatase PglZ type B [Priestia megaterium]|uniref:BREX-1 system phosphatase PglZ type B n=1 Tax=Priestia megaterium TaxID=1404 RepID=UPI0028776026|nr:BREX-1 system phosphatase PglZ type B [Priestia megaterium]
MKVIEQIIKALRDSAAFNLDYQVSPACILWPDFERQWESIIPHLQQELPELFVLGTYEIENKSGPAIWLRCIVANTIEEFKMSKNCIPILYLPGVSRQALRAIDSCPEYLKPLVELQYRGKIWSQANGKDWTTLAFLKSDQGGLGLDVAQDYATLNAIQSSLYRFLDEEIEPLKGRYLNKDYFNTLLSSGDTVRDLLQWLNNEHSFRTTRRVEEWRAFVELCKSQLGFDPENDGALTGAEKLASQEGVWKNIWERFCEAPRKYENIPNLIRQTIPPIDDLFADKSGWPQWNEREEDDLREELLRISEFPPHEAVKRISDLEEVHKERRKTVWAEMGEAPLACALKWLAILAEGTKYSLASGTTNDIMSGYTDQGWVTDCAVLKSLEFVSNSIDYKAVSSVIRTVYLPWAEESARYLQQTVESQGYPGEILTQKNSYTVSGGQCILFVDGLRYDIAKRFIEIVNKYGYQTEEKIRWSALPSVTATAKPAVTPVRNLITGKEATVDFEPVIAETGQSLKGGYHLRKLLTDSGWQILKEDEIGEIKGNGWTEFRDIDHAGHENGWKLAKRINEMLDELYQRVRQLLEAGWKKVDIVTDHGWLFLPGGLPKAELPKFLTDNKWGRCAAIKTGAINEERLFPWYWNSEQSFALADGISCYHAGEEYAHGGLSLQECLTMELSIFSNPSNSFEGDSIELTDITWRGLRCNVAVDGDFSGLSLDIRTQPANPTSSIVMNIKPIKESGIGSVVVENESLEGIEATIVVINSHGQLVSQVKTIVGGGNER